eukprot:5523845-Prymnesium_polylepis.1
MHSAMTDRIAATGVAPRVRGRHRARTGRHRGAQGGAPAVTLPLLSSSSARHIDRSESSLSSCREILSSSRTWRAGGGGEYKRAGCGRSGGCQAAF